MDMNDTISNNINNLLKNSGTSSGASSGDLQQQDLINKALISAGLPNNKINDLVAMARDKLTCNPACQQQRKGDAYKQKWDLAKKNYQNAPEEIKQAEKNYYLFDKGYGAYKEMLYNRYSKTAAEFKTSSNKKHADLQEELQTILNNYESGTTYLKRMNELLKIKLQEKEELSKKIDAYIGFTETSGRKVIYEDRERDTLTLYRKLLNYLFFIIVILYIVFGSFIPDKAYTHWQVWLILFMFVIIPYFLLDRVVKMIFAIYRYMTSWRLKKTTF